MMKRIELTEPECEGIVDFLSRLEGHRTMAYDEWLAHVRRLRDLFDTAESVP